MKEKWFDVHSLSGWRNSAQCVELQHTGGNSSVQLAVTDTEDMSPGCGFFFSFATSCRAHEGLSDLKLSLSHHQRQKQQGTGVEGGGRGKFL